MNFFKQLCQNKAFLCVCSIPLLAGGGNAWAAKKEIFVAGVKSEADNKVRGLIVLEEALTDIYAQEHGLPKYEEYKQGDKKRSDDCMRKEVARERVRPRVKALSTEELRQHYAKIVKGEDGPYHLIHLSFAGRRHGETYFPPFSEELLGAIKAVLFNTWVDREVKTITDAEVGAARKDPKYSEAIERCKEHFYAPGKRAFNDAFLLKAEDLVNGMSEQERKDLWERWKNEYDHPTDTHQQLVDMAKNELEQKALKELAEEYIIKSDSPAVLAAVEKMRAGK